jgi:hypothetical protein
MRSEKLLKKNDTILRLLCNAFHRTFQSRLEVREKGWMKQSKVNKVLGMYGE